MATDALRKKLCGHPVIKKNIYLWPQRYELQIFVSTSEMKPIFNRLIHILSLGLDFI